MPNFDTRISKFIKNFDTVSILKNLGTLNDIRLEFRGVDLHFTLSQLCLFPADKSLALSHRIFDTN
jgi:hypothetical protein